MLEVLDFIAERGGDPKKVRESQRLRYAPETVIDEVIELWQDARKSKFLRVSCTSSADLLLARYDANQMNAKINAVQKEIGQLRKVSGGILPALS